MSKIPVFRFRDTAIFIGWIGGIILIGCLCWILTKNFRQELLQASVNRAWTRAGYSSQLGEPLASVKPNLARLGSWYTRDDGNRILVFTVMADGIYLPCAAVVNPKGSVEEILPLGQSGEKLLNRVSPGLLRMYIRRIEEQK